MDTRTLILKSGLSRKKLAVKSGIFESALSNYVHGRRVPTAQIAAKLAKATGTKASIQNERWEFTK